jgi:polyisoprenoid-binding protein YceI
MQPITCDACEQDKLVGADSQFTLLSAARPLSVTVKRFACGEHPVMKKPISAGDIAATIKPSVHGMTKYFPTLSDEIRISVPVEAYRN